jgi:hypothetical protein
MGIRQLPEARVAEMIARVVAYFRQERALYQRASEPLAPVWKSGLQDYFGKSLLDTIRTVTLEGARIPLATVLLRSPSHGRTLFHGLVHAQQMAALGLETYASFYLRGFLKTRSWTSIPLEAQAFQLEARFSMTPPEVFSVEEVIKHWASNQRY